ncbi:glycosyltransferase family 9 protein [Roseisolibacter sp. H3M3-2]|uniref:glycosyltransferase family 9 protein n=1 Tax=Roseisolibacter sp. H3M3-2 TaxID=3031323 RepID=UPI0023DAA495|nr:glycosyltransferase family 9 protein [Roseisolibacter sp. H3M3-2]MDF1504604.1 glycosyltransferase family 9 protein [Roseisolibacter sp. H3M3-2]
MSGDAGGRRVCLVLLTGLGDVVHGLPIATALRDSGFARHLTWVAEPMPAQLLAPHPCIDDVVVYRRREGVAGVRALRETLAARKRAHGSFDVTINLNVYFKSVWPVLFAGGRRRLGFDRTRAKDGIWLAYNDTVPPRPRSHTQDMFLEFLAHLGVPHHPPAAPDDWRITFTPEERAAQAAWLAERSGRPIAAIVPASAIDRKDWPADRWARVADALAGDFGYEVVLVGGPGGRETAIARAIAEQARHPLTWAMGDGVRRVAWVLERSALVLAPDTGPLHVARALGVPVIGLFGHTNPWRVGPYRAWEELWVDAYTDPGTAPDPSRFDPPADDRMRLITVEDVIERVRRARALRRRES